MDVAQKLSPHSKAFDAVFFMATTKDGFYLVGGAERRHSGVVNGLFYVAVPGVGLLCSSKIPDTVLHGARENEFGAEGIRFIPIEPMKHWRVEFEGDMWHHDDPNKTSKVVVRGDWKSNLPYFDFDTDSNISTMCSAIARESWSREYFEFLKNAHQSHYEQMGTLKATVTLDGKEYRLDCQAFRDHSYGFKRDWKLMHRYIFHMLFLEDGTTASIGVICQPCTCSVLKIGYVYKPDGTLYPLEWCDLQLYQHGENGSPPRDHAFSFKAGGTVYRVQVDVEYESIHYKGEEREARMVERFVRYHVNGKVKGRGVSEFHYNNSNDVKRGTV
ncbi:uncharacterized protein LOC107264026 isoform X2 [Cephus cinctus]|nr:uncharacterized protein LOC107264026 isoform X2 [Cephus cinctus]